MSSRILVVYYSMGGNTRAIANEIRDLTGADIEEIAEPHRRHGLSGVVRALFDTMLRRSPAIIPAAYDPAVFEALLLGGPVWGGRMAAPVRAYAKRYGGRPLRVGFFCTEGGHGADTAFADLEQLCQQKADATLVVDAAHLDPDQHRAELARFAAHFPGSGADAAQSGAAPATREAPQGAL